MATNNNCAGCGCGPSIPEPCVTPPPICPDPQPCVEIVNAECVIYTSAPIVCDEDIIVATNTSVDVAMNQIAAYFCGLEPEGGKFAGTNYVFVMADGTAVENAAELQAAYDELITRSPSATNRMTVIAAPGYYNFGATTFTMTTEHIDLVSLDGNRSIIFNSSDPVGTINIVANDVFVKGVDVQTKNFTIATNLNLLKVENCKGGNESFGGDNSFQSNPINASGTFTNCTGGNASFGGYCTASGTFTNCIGGTYSFGGAGIASGIFVNCTGTTYLFGFTGIASGTFTNCIAGDGFAGCGIASGIFTNCIGGNFSFGNDGGPYTGTLSGKLYYCRITTGTFKTVSGGGITRLCLDGTNAENNQG